MSMPVAPPVYPARLEVDYSDQHNRVTTLFRIVLIIPIAILYGVLTAGATRTVYDQSGNVVSTTSGGIAAGLFLATLLMIVIRQRYPRWWFDFVLELARFGARLGAYLVLLTDQYPSTVDTQNVHLDIDYPDVATRSESLAAAGEVAARDPALPCPHRPVGGSLLRGRLRVVRDPLHRTLSAGAVRLRCRRRPLVAASRGICVPAGHGPIPAVLSQLSFPSCSCARSQGPARALCCELAAEWSGPLLDPRRAQGASRYVGMAVLAAREAQPSASGRWVAPPPELSG